MNAVWAIVLVAAVIAAPSLVAHTGDHNEHLSVTVEAVLAGSENVYRLAFEGGDFAAGWVFFVYGGVQGNVSAQLTLSTAANTTTVASWMWEPGQFHLNSTRLPETGEYWLVVANPSDSEDIQVAFYYDQSCECLDKTIGLAGGPAVFNLHVNEGRTVSYDLIISHIDPSLGPVAPRGVRTQVEVTRLTDERAVWPDDFEILETATTDGARMHVEWTADQDGTYYVWVTPLEGATPQQPVHYRPAVDVSDGGGAPGIGAVTAAFVLVAAVAAMRFKGTR